MQRHWVYHRICQNEILHTRERITDYWISITNHYALDSTVTCLFACLLVNLWNIALIVFFTTMYTLSSLVLSVPVHVRSWRKRSVESYINLSILLFPLLFYVLCFLTFLISSFLIHVPRKLNFRRPVWGERVSICRIIRGIYIH